MKVAVSVCRIADAEWLRACEEVRRVSPTIGSVGEWKAFCEGIAHYPWLVLRSLTVSRRLDG